MCGALVIARSLQRQGNRKLSDLANLRMWLVEHLGVAYRGYLELDPETLEPSAKIAVTIGQNSILGAAHSGACYDGPHGKGGGGIGRSGGCR